MSTIPFRRKLRQGLNKLPVLIEDRTAYSPFYFDVRYFPDVFKIGKNLFKLRGGSYLETDSEIKIELYDRDGNPIYYEIINYNEQDGTKVVSVWTYKGRADLTENTPSGLGTCVIVGTARYDQNGNLLDREQRSRPNIRWTRQFYIQTSEKNDSEIIFVNTPKITISESIDSFTVTHYDYDTITTSSNYSSFSYLYKGTSPIVTDANAGFVNAQLSGTLELRYLPGNGLPTFKTATSIASNYTHSAVIVEVINSSNVRLATPATASQGFGGSIRSNYNRHTWQSISTGNGKVTWKPPRSGSGSENKRSIANITLTNIEPSTGEVARILSYIKSNNITSTYELVNDVPVVQSSSLSIKVPIPTEQRYNDLNIKLQYLNSKGEASRYETIIENQLFRGGNQYIEEGDNLLTGSLFVSSATGGGVEISGKFGGGYLRSIGYEGFVSASAGSGSAGFLLWSGSVLTNSGDNYDGVGIELHAGPGSGSLRFRTSPTALFEVDVKSFILGDLNSQYISGSGGVIEISSSNFVVDNGGSVSANNITLTNIARADYFSFKEVVVTSENTGSYFKYWSGNSTPEEVYCILDLSGIASPFADSASKEACMYIRFFRNPEFPISHIISPDFSTRTTSFNTDAYAGPILIETYGPAYSGSGCGAGLPNSDVFLAYEATMEGPEADNNTILIPSFSAAATVYGAIGTWQTDGTMPSSIYDLRTPLRITSEENDWVSGSFTYTTNWSDNFDCNAPYDNNLAKLAPGGRYLMYPGANGWRLLATSNYMNLDPLFDKLTVSQSLLIGDKGTLNSAAALQVDSNEKGILFPRMDTTSRDLIAAGSPPAGLVIFNTSSGANVLQFYNGSTWGNV